MNYLRLAITAPARAWAWGQSHPFEAIGYGLIVLLGAWLARPLLVAVAAAASRGRPENLVLEIEPMWNQKDYAARQRHRQAEADRAALSRPVEKPKPYPTRTFEEYQEGRQRTEAAYDEYDRLVKEIEG